MTTVLVVDDNEASLYTLGRTLQQAGFLVWEAATGAEALARAHEGPDVVMLDIKLPDITGLEVCRRLKRDPATAGIPVLQMTATFGSSEVQAAALEGGADAYLTHPIEPIVLIATLRSLLRAREAETRARRLTAWWQSTFDAIQDGVMLLSRSGQVLRCNRAMAEMLGRSPEEIVGDAGLPALAEGAIPSQDWPLARALSERRRVARDVQVGSRWFEIVADPVLDESVEVSAVVTTVKDITDRRAAEAQLEALLASEQRARKEAEQVNRMKDEFLATLSHELRTPLNAIVGWTHILRTGPWTRSGRSRRSTPSPATRTQTQLIADILDVSRIIAGKLRLELRPVDLADVVRPRSTPCGRRPRPRGSASTACWIPAAGPLTGDAGRLQQVVWNLLSNAIKFTPRGGRVAVRIERVDSSTRLTVEDNGPGVAPEFLPHVFERFRQADSSSTRPHGGLGLGLAIVRHLVELHGGTVDAANRIDGSGAIFRVTLPSPALFAAASEGRTEIEAARGGPPVDAVRPASRGRQRAGGGRRRGRAQPPAVRARALGSRGHHRRERGRGGAGAARAPARRAARGHRDARRGRVLADGEGARAAGGRGRRRARGGSHRVRERPGPPAGAAGGLSAPRGEAGLAGRRDPRRGDAARPRPAADLRPAGTGAARAYTPRGRGRPCPRPRRPQEAARVLSPGHRLGPYEILARIGGGGMGEVYRARDPRLGRDVAVKVLRASLALTEERVQALGREARAAGSLNHPNIVTVFDVATDGDVPYVVTELLEGESLRERLAGGALPFRKAVEYGIQIAEALGAAHEKGIVHRDVKPENAFVTREGRVKLLDFGLAKLRESEPAGRPRRRDHRGQASGVRGTAGYMSPEQVTGAPLDPRTDIFSLGTVLYEMFTGVQPFQRASRGRTHDRRSARRAARPRRSSTRRSARPPWWR